MLQKSGNAVVSAFIHSACAAAETVSSSMATTSPRF